jgi:precorrin-2 methylase
MKIEQAFADMDTIVVVKVTQFNYKKFNDYITLLDAKHQIFLAIGLELSHHHGITFE